MPLRRALSSLAFAVVVLAATSPQAGAQAPTAGQLAAAGELLELTQAARAMREGMDVAFAAQVKENPMMSAFQPTIRTFLDKHLSWAIVKPEMAAIWAARFTEAELRQLIAFHRTPVGQKLVAEQVGLTTAAMAVAQRIVTTNAEELQSALAAKAAELGAATGGAPAKP